MSRNVGLQILRGILAHIPALLVGECFFATDTQQIYIGTSGGNKLVSATPVYDHTGVLVISPHIVSDDVTMTGASATITLSGASVFSSATSYRVFVTDAQNKRTLNVIRNSGASFTISGGGNGDVVSYLCIGT